MTYVSALGKIWGFEKAYLNSKVWKGHQQSHLQNGGFRILQYHNSCFLNLGFSKQPWKSDLHQKLLWCEPSLFSHPKLGCYDNHGHNFDFYGSGGCDSDWECWLGNGFLLVFLRWHINYDPHKSFGQFFDIFYQVRFQFMKTTASSISILFLKGTKESKMFPTPGNPTKNWSKNPIGLSYQSWFMEFSSLFATPILSSKVTTFTLSVWKGPKPRSTMWLSILLPFWYPC